MPHTVEYYVNPDYVLFGFSERATETVFKVVNYQALHDAEYLCVAVFAGKNSFCLEAW